MDIIESISWIVVNLSSQREYFQYFKFSFSTNTFEQNYFFTDYETCCLKYQIGIDDESFANRDILHLSSSSKNNNFIRQRYF